MSQDVSSENLDAVRQYRPGNQTRNNEDYRQDRYNNQRKQWQTGNKEKLKCEFCKKPAHQRDRCPARNFICHVCKHRGHWPRAKACKAASKMRTDEVECELEGLFLGDSE